MKTCSTKLPGRLPLMAAIFSSLIASGVLAAQAPRAARSVHLNYPAPTSDLFYNEVLVERSTGGSYFMVCGWNTGYFGMQQLGSPTNKVVIFSVWDPTKGDDPSKVPPEQRVETLFEGEGTRVKRFGDEGTGGQCLWNYQWETNEICRFIVQATVTSNKTSYAGWFYDNRAKSWKHLVTFRTRTDGKPPGGYYSFVEDFLRNGASAGEVRRARFGHGWVREQNGLWTQLLKASFTASSSAWEAKETVDAGIAGDMFYLQTGGDTQRSLELGSAVELPPHKAKPPEVPEELSRRQNP